MARRFARRRADVHFGNGGPASCTESTTRRGCSPGRTSGTARDRLGPDTLRTTRSLTAPCWEMTFRVRAGVRFRTMPLCIRPRAKAGAIAIREMVDQRLATFFPTQPLLPQPWPRVPQLSRGMYTADSPDTT